MLYAYVEIKGNGQTDDVYSGEDQEKEGEIQEEKEEDTKFLK